jgi:16S rRNA (adenine1518-N6/adenine1519-N6)-dimethyltransferase
MNVSPGCFIPRPEVYSSVVRLKLKEKLPVGPEVKETFFSMVRAAFGQRRKTLINALSNSGNFNISREEIRQRLIDAGVEPDCRGETLSVMQFAELSISFSAKTI